MKIKQDGKISQPLMIAVLIGLTLMLCTAIWLSTNKSDADKTESEGENSEAKKSDTEAEHAEEGELQLTAQQMVEQGIKIATAENGLVENIIQLPGKLAVNTDQQAHISPNFSGHVEQVSVALGQTVQKGQTLAVLSVPELIDQQANLRMAEANLDLARQDYQREQKLWSQGISAKQDFQRAENAYRQAQISVQSAQSRLQALGVNGSQNGRFIIRAPIAGVISQKDIVVGENVQLADQLFTIEQLKDLWLEFHLPNQYSGQLQAGQNVSFKINGSDQLYSAEVQSLTSQADVQTGRLVVRAKLKQQSVELRPNVMVNVLLADSGTKNALRVQKSAVQSIEGKDSIFIVESEQKGQVHLKAQALKLGQASSDGQWLEVLSGLEAGQKYISQGSFLLKSELEKDEAGHEH
ncbi:MULTISPECIES: efflux RND transporter periplasmic adaptor subunit [Acinetobacter]|uniref:efflux RND transporter periplasmic adaptor subunit n=1 Tax=Acinetobacter TaxID=469 RepID=UPI000EA225D6|nr:MULTISPECIES: efflux RND transporter periplasmic adaptor subunit [Acinetobacter]RKG46897.1 efflux RND transporter periplasmic adaptor subunit [Acinetobacter cumulans]RZG62292.1 efflux RND transporter periplasmic adaptor subunit [Acinetobacter sp. WCHAc060006]